VSSREQLFHVLAEAAELEHNILCSYLYAAFSLKARADEDATPAELAALARWRGELMGLCVEEMVHLAQVCNLLCALGSRPHFNRPNLPSPPGCHPARIAIGLSPFDMETLDHFIFLERPPESSAKDEQPFAKPEGSSERPEVEFDPLMPRAPDYETIGEFYAELARQLDEAAESMGEGALFVGGPDVQISGSEIGSEDLVMVDGLGAARAAIEFIVEQGEGSRGDREGSHFGKFIAIKTEYEELVARRPQFKPCRDVARNPVMHAPVEKDRVHVNGGMAAPVMDAANAAYGLMLRCLAKVYEAPRSEPDLRAALLEGAMAAMKTVNALGGAITELPARDEGSVRAGVSFAMLRTPPSSRRKS
jgi:hypothetical protein